MSFWRTPIPELQAQYRQIVRRPAPRAVDAALKREIEELRFKCSSLDSEVFDVSRCLEEERAMVKRVQESERRLRRSNRVLEEEAVKERKELVRTIDNLKKEIDELKSVKSERQSNWASEEKAIEAGEERKEKIGELKSVKSEDGIDDRFSELQRMNKVLQTEKAELKAKVRKLEKQKKLDMVEAQKTELFMKIEFLEKEKKREGRISELLQMNKTLQAEKIALKAEVRKLEDAKKDNEPRRVRQKKLKTLEAQKTELKSEIERMMNDNGRLENRVSELVLKNDDLEKEKGAIEADFRKTNADKSTEIERMLSENLALEDQFRDLDLEKSILVERIDILEEEKRALEEEGKKKESTLCKYIQELEEENNEMNAKVCRAKTEKSEEVRRIMNEKILEDYERKGAMEDYEKKISELVDKNDTLERETKGFEARIIEKDELMGGLKREKGALEAAVLNIDLEKSKEIERIWNEKMTLEAEKRSTEDKIAKRFEAVEREKIKDVRMILNETMALKEDYEKQISELVDRNNTLESEKKELEIEINFMASLLMDKMQIIQQLRFSNGDVTLSTRQQNEVKKFADINRNDENSDGRNEDGMTRKNACKRKRTIKKSEKAGGKKIRKTSRLRVQVHYPEGRKMT